MAFMPGYKPPAVVGMPKEAFSPVAGDVLIGERIPQDILTQMRNYVVPPVDVSLLPFAAEDRERLSKLSREELAEEYRRSRGLVPPPTPVQPPPSSTGTALSSPLLPNLPDIGSIADGGLFDQFNDPFALQLPKAPGQRRSSGGYPFPEYRSGESSVLPALPSLDDLSLNSYAS